MVRLIIAERAKLKGDYFKQVEPNELTDIGIGQMVYECDQLKEKLEELHAKMNETED